MKKRKKEPEDLRLDPQDNICPIYDHTSIRMFSVADTGEMGMRVLDDCAEDHIM